MVFLWPRFGPIAAKFKDNLLHVWGGEVQYGLEELQKQPPTRNTASNTRLTKVVMLRALEFETMEVPIKWHAEAAFIWGDRNSISSSTCTETSYYHVKNEVCIHMISVVARNHLSVQCMLEFTRPKGMRAGTKDRKLVSRFRML